jgi:micrococcal nuclease
MTASALTMDRWRSSRACVLAILWCLGLMLALDLGAARAASGSWSGQVLSVVAGDTLKILQGKLARTVRLAGIDAPNPGQPWGDEARRFVQGLAEGHTVTVEPDDKTGGRQQRGQVILPDGRDLGLELLKEGLAWHDKRRSADPFLGELESNARKERLGLWGDAHPVPPWRWRSRGR